MKYTTTEQGGLIQPLPVPKVVWNEVTIDFVVGLPKSSGCTVILVVVNRLTKYAHFLGLPMHYNAITVADLFLQIVVKLHGFPLVVVSNRDPIFLSFFSIFYLRRVETF